MKESLVVTFLLQLYFDVDKLSEKESSIIGDQLIEKEFTLPVLPRIGEDLSAGDFLKVVDVSYDLRTGGIQILCNVGLLEGVDVYNATGEEGWDLSKLRPDGRKLFFTWLQEHREAKKPKP